MEDHRAQPGGPPDERTEWSIFELAAEVGIAPRTIRMYIQRGVITRVEHRGAKTVYGRRQWLQLQAVRRLRRTTSSLDAIKRKVVNAKEEELAKLAGLPTQAAAAREPARRDRPSPAKMQESSAAVVAGLAAGGAPAGDAVPDDAIDGPRWRHVPLLSGLELLVRDGAGPLVERLAREIHDRYAVRRG